MKTIGTIGKYKVKLVTKDLNNNKVWIILTHI